MGGLRGAGLSRRHHSTSDAVSAVHMHNIQMPRPWSQRVLRDGLQLGSSGRQLKLGLPRPQALAMGTGMVPLNEAGQVGKHCLQVAEVLINDSLLSQHLPIGGHHDALPAIAYQ